jgi:anaerobic selenocysteine-containing dehydrogenase
MDLQAGDVVRVESRRGRIEAPLRVSGSRDGFVFAPFHYGSWRSSAGPAPRRSDADPSRACFC